MDSPVVQPYEVRDFSGGMTDYFLQGGPTRYQRADNLIINIDRKLESRYGSCPLDSVNYRIPGQPRRIDGFVHFNNERELFAQAGRDIHYLNPNWTRLLGPTGNEVLGSGGSYTQVTYSDWNGHSFLVPNSGAIPSKIYRDKLGALQVRTAGLPKPKCVPGYTNASLLNACIALANDLRTSMVNHIKDISNTNPFGGAVAGFLHGLLDKWSLSYFETQTWFIFDTEYPGPTPTPTPRPLATDQNSLFNLIEALCLAFEHHGADAFNSFYHFEVLLDTGGGGSTVPPKGPYQRLNDNTRPTTLEQAARQLDELRTKWYWHQFNVYTHAAFNDYSGMNKYRVTQPAIGTIDLDGVPKLTPNYQPFFNYVNRLKQVFNAHVTNGVVDYFTVIDYWHYQLENSLFYHHVTLPDATDLDTAYLILYWVRVMYGSLHVFDSNWPQHTNFTMDTTSGSANVADVKIGGSPITLPTDAWVISTNAIFNDPNPDNQKAARVVSSASGTATLSKTLQNTVGDQPVQHSLSFYHGATQFGSLITTTNQRAGTDEFLEGSVGEDWVMPPTLEAWIEDGAELFNAIAAHIGNGATHIQGEAIVNFLQGGGFYKPEVSSYAYSFTYKYKYTTENGVEFLNISTPIFAGPIETCKIYPKFTELPAGIESDFVDDGIVTEVATVGISNLPTLANDPSTNYDTAEIDVQIYRTIDSGNTYYLEGEVDNGTVSFTDGIADSLDGPGVNRLDAREVLYTTGGIVANESPPLCRYLHILNDIAYYGDITDAGQRFPNRILQSIPGSPDAVSLTFFDDIEDFLMGISSTRNNVVALGRTSVYRLSGSFNNLGQGAITHERISDEIGCISTRSIVRTEIGIFFAGNDGFYFTDGFQLIKISIDLDETYAKLTRTEEQRTRITGSYDRLTRRIWWTVQEEATDTDCNACFIFYLNYGVKPSGVFTTASNGSHFRPSAVTFHQGYLIRGDKRGLLFRHDPNYKTDPKVPADVSTPLAEWGTVHLPYDYRSCALDFGNTATGQWVTKIHVLGKNAGNASFHVNSIKENNLLTKRATAPVRYVRNPIWGDATIDWGDPDFTWRYDGKLDEKRRFPAGSLRSQFRQLQITPADDVGVYRYEDFPEGSTADVDATAKTATIATPSGYTEILWPLDVDDMRIAFSTDNYEQEFAIESVLDDELTFLDPGNLAVSDPAATWVIRGVMKEQRISILSYLLQFSAFGEPGAAYAGFESRGENAQ